MYKQYIGANGSLANGILRLSDNACIPFDPANTDYANFKKEILADEAQIQDVDGNVMTQSETDAFIGTLP